MSNKKIVQRIVVGGVLVDKEKNILILQRHSNETTYPDMWELPSGKREYLEPTMTAIIREFKEEVGVDIKIISTISVFDYLIEKPDETRDSTQINFLVELTNENQEIKISEEHQKYTWINESMLNDFNLTESTKEVLRIGFKIVNNINKYN